MVELQNFLNAPRMLVNVVLNALVVVAFNLLLSNRGTGNLKTNME